MCMALHMLAGVNVVGLDLDIPGLMQGARRYGFLTGRFERRPWRPAQG